MAESHAVETEPLAQQFERWSTERLLRAAAAPPSEFSEPAREAILAELGARDVAISELPSTEELDRAELTGVRGWLLFFVITVAFNAAWQLLSGAAGVQLAVAASAGGQYLPPSAFVGFPQAGIGALGFAVFALLLKRHSMAPMLAQAWLAAGILLSLVAFVMGGGAAPWIYPIIWLVYLRRSKRVAFTYERPGTPAPSA
jgi:hypothetical protein